jgi:hypothetical protein
MNRAVRSFAQQLGRLALVLQLALVALPVLDAAVFHADAHRDQIHIEAAGADCHHAECVIGQSLLIGSGLPGPEAVVLEREPTRLLTLRPQAGVPRLPARGIPLGPRGPPATH